MYIYTTRNKEYRYILYTNLTQLLESVATSTFYTGDYISKKGAYILLTSSPCQRQCELLPSLGVRRPLSCF